MSGAEDVPMEPKSEEQMLDRHAVASGEEEKPHEGNVMRNVHIGKRESETAHEEHADNLWKTVRFEPMHVSVEYLASGEKHDRPEPVLVQNSGHVDDDIQISAYDVFYEMD